MVTLVDRNVVNVAFCKYAAVVLYSDEGRAVLVGLV